MTKPNQRALDYLDDIEKGAIPKNHLTNHGKDFTGGAEQLAREAFVRYEGSCGRKLMQLRLKEKGCKYIG